jgi:hypothetical protein
MSQEPIEQIASIRKQIDGLERDINAIQEACQHAWAETERDLGIYRYAIVERSCSKCGLSGGCWEKRRERIPQ